MLNAQQESLLSEALDRFEAAVSVAKEAAASTEGFMTWGWGKIVGSDSTQAAIRAEYLATEKLYNVMRARFQQDVRELDLSGLNRRLAEIKVYADVSDLVARAQFTSASGGLTVIAKETASDVGKLALPLSGAIGLALLAFLFLKFGGKK